MPQVSRSKGFFHFLFPPYPGRTENVKTARLSAKKFILLFLAILLYVHPAYASVRYRVRKGDTLSRIAKRYKISVKKLKRENGLSSNRLKPGKKLRIREAGRRHKTRRSARRLLHARHYAYRHAHRYAKRIRAHQTAVASGNSRIKDKYQGIIAGNGKNENIKTAVNVMPSIANIPESALTNSTTSAIFNSILQEAKKDNRAAAAARNYKRKYEAKYHRVRRGETLFSIARRYGTTVKQLKHLNGLKSKRARLRKGQKLLVKRSVHEVAVASGTYRVKKGDTFFRIARKFHLEPEELMSINEMDTEDLRPGQTIMLTDKAANETAPAASADTRIAAPQIETQIKELQGSETLQSLSIKDRMMLFAKLMLNIPYRFGGSSFYGIDCSAFVQKVFNLLNIPLPRTARQQFTEGVPVSLDDLSIGDLVFFRTYASFPSHVGIYIGQNLFIHASSGGHRVKIGSLLTPYFMKRLIGAKRLLTGEEGLQLPVSAK